MKWLLSVGFVTTITTALLAACTSSAPTLPTQANFDLEKYTGVWYEQALLPNRFQKECVAEVQAEYSLLSTGSLQVENQCKKADGEITTAQADGRLNTSINPPNPAILEVRFAPAWLSWLPMVWGNYWVIKIEGDYQYSLVGTPDREYLWVLSRDKAPNLETVNALLDYAGTLGFDITQVKYTQQ